MVLEAGKSRLKSMAQTSDWLKNMAHTSDWFKSVAPVSDWFLLRPQAAATVVES